VSLTPNQKIFADEYLIDLNATRAYKHAYKNVKKDETAAVNGSISPLNWLYVLCSLP
jgi:phage terminase small subunit